MKLYVFHESKSLNQFIITLVLCRAISLGNAINCFKCTSDKDPACAEKKPSGPAVPAENCDNPNTLLQNWINSQGLSKYGIGNINLEKAIEGIDKTGSDKANLKNITACAYFIVSTENKVTAGIDDAASKTRNFFGDANSKDPLTIQKWILRDCVTLKLHEGAEKEANRCVPTPAEIRDTVKLHLCTCAKDQCNEGKDSLKALIAESESGGSLGKDAGSLGALIAIASVSLKAVY